MEDTASGMLMDILIPLFRVERLNDREVPWHNVLSGVLNATQMGEISIGASCYFRLQKHVVQNHRETSRVRATVAEHVVIITRKAKAAVGPLRSGQIRESAVGERFVVAEG